MSKVESDDPHLTNTAHSPQSLSVRTVGGVSRGYRNPGAGQSEELHSPDLGGTGVWECQMRALNGHGYLEKG